MTFEASKRMASALLYILSMFGLCTYPTPIHQTHPGQPGNWVGPYWQPEISILHSKWASKRVFYMTPNLLPGMLQIS
jgi:hypothetical protein